jgi:hypothetical protein
MQKNGTRYAGMSAKGNWAIAAVETFPISPWIPWKKPEHKPPRDMATMRSVIPKIFHITNRWLVANEGL